MLITSLLACAAITQANALLIDYSQGAFTISGEGFSQTVQVIEDPLRPQRAMSVRSGDYWVVWDDRGLSIRDGNTLTTTWLEDVPTSPRVQNRDDIVKTAELISQGRRSRKAAALSGWQFVGDDIYMVFRWEEQDGRPWLEALFKVNVTARDRKPTLVGRFDGLSQARKPLEDRLFLHDGEPAMIVTREGDWGVASWDLESNQAAYRPLGTRLTNAMASPDGDDVFFVEVTTYGMSVAGRIPLDGGERERYAEFRGNGTFVATAPPILCIEDERGVRYRLCASGQEQSFALGTSAVMTERGLLVFSPKEAPQRAVLVSTEDLTPLARWSLN